MGSDPTLDNDVAGFLADLRTAYTSEPDEAVASRQLAAIAREAELALPRRTKQPAGWRIMNRNRFRRPALTLGAAALAALLGTAGLAVAGVDLPDPATKAFERVGISLPNQAGGGDGGEHSRSDDVPSVIEATPPSERGCAFGHAVAEAAKGSPLPEHARAACDPGRGAEAQNNSNRSEFGRDTAERARGLKDATVEERRSFGEDTAERAKELGGAPEGTPGAEQRGESPGGGGTTGAPEGTPTGPPEGTPAGQVDTLPAPDDTPAGPPAGTPGGGP